MIDSVDSVDSFILRSMDDDLIWYRWHGDCIGESSDQFRLIRLKNIRHHSSHQSTTHQKNEIWFLFSSILFFIFDSSFSFIVQHQKHHHRRTQSSSLLVSTKFLLTPQRGSFLEYLKLNSHAQSLQVQRNVTADTAGWSRLPTLSRGCATQGLSFCRYSWLNRYPHGYRLIPHRN